MIKIGIVGSDNSHALWFSKIANLKDADGKYAYEDVRVTALFGLDEERTKFVAKEGNIEYIAKTPEDLMSRVDAVMVVFRHGNLHYEYALPFIQAGIPTWIDKPFTIDLEEADKLIQLAKEHQVLLAGGSTCKYGYDVLMLQNSFKELNKDQSVISAAFNFPGDLNSEYGGIYFYGGHAIEILTTIFGHAIRSIKTDVHCNNLIAIVKYDTFTVTINFSQTDQFFGTIYTDSKVVTREIDISMVYKLGFSKFVEMLRTGKMVEDYESLRQPVKLLNALEQSIQTEKEIFI